MMKTLWRWVMMRLYNNVNRLKATELQEIGKGNGKIGKGIKWYTLNVYKY